MNTCKFTKLQALFVCQICAWEGVEYGLTQKTSYSAIRDKKFQDLRKAYCNGDKKAGEQLKKYVLKTAGRKNFRYPSDRVFDEWTPEQVKKESDRWDRARERDVQKYLKLMNEWEAAEEKGKQDRQAIEASIHPNSGLTAPTPKNILS